MLVWNLIMGIITGIQWAFSAIAWIAGCVFICLGSLGYIMLLPFRFLAWLLWLPVWLMEGLGSLLLMFPAWFVSIFGELFQQLLTALILLVLLEVIMTRLYEKERCE